MYITYKYDLSIWTIKYIILISNGDKNLFIGELSVFKFYSFWIYFFKKILFITVVEAEGIENLK